VETENIFKNSIFWGLTHVALVTTNVLEERITSIITMERISELRAMPILSTQLIDVIRSSESWFLQQPHTITSQETAFFILTAVKTLNLTNKQNKLRGP
jgi:hypothetical protein